MSFVRLAAHARGGVAGALRAALCALCAGCCVVLVAASPAGAVAPAVGWSIHSFAAPSVFLASGGADSYRVTVRDAGSAPADGSAVVLTDVPAAGVVVQGVHLFWSAFPEVDLAGLVGCTTSPVRCSFSTAEFGLPPFAPDDTLKMVLDVTVQPGVTGGLVNTATVSGGGAGEASTSATNQAGSVPALFGPGLAVAFAGLDGMADVQAGAHPYELTARIDLNNEFRRDAHAYGVVATSVQDLRDIVFDLPLGFLGSALATPQCTYSQLSAHIEHGIASCPPDTIIGHIFTEPQAGGVGSTSVDGPIYNMVPDRGFAAEFAFADSQQAPHGLYASVVPSAAGYVLRSTTPEISQVTLTDIEITLFGEPTVRDGGGNTPVPFFTNPSDCSGEPLVTSLHADSWQSPGRYNGDGTPDFSDPAWVGATSVSPPVVGCDRLRFDPSLSVRPETSVGNTPTGLNVDLKVPQNEEPETLVTPPLRDASVVLPVGVSLNPSAAGGLSACSEAQVGLGSAAPPACPESSKIGSVEAESPLLAGTLQGSVYLAAQNENPFHSLLAGYIVIDDPATGVVVKVPGQFEPDPSTGQITAVFKDSPQFQLSDLRLHFFGGPRAPLVTPGNCGTFTTTSDLMPWSAPDSGPDATPSSSFPVDSGCVTGFAPSFSAGSVNPQAGAFSALTVTVSRSDQDQNLSGVTVTTPPGLLGLLKSVERCPEPQASQGTCGPNSLIGHTTVAAGAGPNPFWVQGGQVFLTGPYKGSPFGLSVVVRAVAGPFDLGNVVVRAAIHVDPHTAQVTVTSDPLPTILQGIPLAIRTVNVTIDRQGFLFNPTNCEPLGVTGSLTSTGGAMVGVSSHFQAANCQGLPFHPVFTVSTQARTSKKNGASLTVKTTIPAGAQANIRSVATVLPKQLPARLTTIQQACTAAAFNANPATCPAGSVIGTGIAMTPILANPLVGPAYLVSHGGAAFPDVVIVFQSEGVTLDLLGSVNIRHGITSSDFATIPDAPISSFQLTLPEGPHSGLAAVLPAKAKGSMCGQKLTMPFTLTAQNGAQLDQNVKIAVTGCGKPKKAHRHAKGKPGKAHGHAKGKKKKG
jgi:hypothetical protein